MSLIRIKHIIPYFLMIPAIAIGTLTMISYGLPLRIWIQNALFWFVAFILGYIFVMSRNKNNLNKDNFLFYLITAILVILLLMVPFLFNGLDGVYRWVVWGPIRLQISSIFLPMLIVILRNLLLRQHIFCVLVLAVGTLFILQLQPDASQVSAFAGASIIIIWKALQMKAGLKEHLAFPSSPQYNKLLKIIYLVSAVIATILSWTFLDNLAPVPYVESIIYLTLHMGGIWLVAVIVSLVLLLLPFFILHKSILSISLGVYFLITIIATFFGNFPVPIMGYGASPIIGYSIAVALLSEYPVYA